jgi:hypothetical protein
MGDPLMGFDLLYQELRDVSGAGLRALFGEAEWCVEVCGATPQTARWTLSLPESNCMVAAE